LTLQDNLPESRIDYLNRIDIDSIVAINRFIFVRKNSGELFGKDVALD